MLGEPLLPADGRDYKSLKEVQEAFDADEEFLTAHKLPTTMSELRKMHPEKEKFRVRYKRMTKTNFVKMPPPPDFGETTDEAKSKEWLKKGLEYKKNANWDLSIHCFSEAISLDPVPREGWYERGLVYSGRRSHMEAIEDFTETIERGNPLQEGPFLLGIEEIAQEYLAIGEFDKAATDLFRRGFEQDCVRVIGLVKEAVDGLLATGKYDRAIEVIEELRTRAEWDHNHELILSHAIGMRAEYEFLMGQSATLDSIESLKKSVREEGEDTHSNLDLLAKACKKNACMLFGEEEGEEEVRSEDFGWLAQAISDFSHAILLHPEDVDALEFRGLAYLKVVWSKKERDPEHDCEDLYNLAIEDCNAAIRLDPKRAPAWSNKADAYAQKSDHQEALKNYDEAIRLDPKDAGHYWGRNRTHTALGNTSEAAADNAMFTQLIREDMWGEDD